MQTFLPYISFERSASCLDRMRLGKQRVEVLEILVILSNEQPDWMSDAWYARCLRHVKHPAVCMWRHHHESLIEYGITICSEWRRRGYNDNCQTHIIDLSCGNEVILPPWLGNRKFHQSHRSNLVRKDPIYYRQFFPNVPNNLSYIWPVLEKVS